MVRTGPLWLLMLLAACGGPTLPSVVEQTQDGVTALVRTDVEESKDGLIVMNTIDRHGFIRRQGPCLVVDHSGQEYSPVFRTAETFRLALMFAKSQASTSLELSGDPLSKVRRGYNKERTSYCDRPLFLLAGIGPIIHPEPRAPSPYTTSEIPLARYSTVNPRSADKMALLQGKLTVRDGCLGVMQTDGTYNTLFFYQDDQSVSWRAGKLANEGDSFQLGEHVILTGAYADANFQGRTLDARSKACVASAVFFVGPQGVRRP